MSGSLSSDFHHHGLFLSVLEEVKRNEVAQSCLTLCDPMDCSLLGSSVHGIFQARVLGWVAISFSRGFFLTQGSNPGLLHCRQDALPSEVPGKSVLEPHINRMSNF